MKYFHILSCMVLADSQVVQLRRAIAIACPMHALKTDNLGRELI